MALTLRRRCHHDRDGAERIKIDRGGRQRAVLRPCAAPLFGSQCGGDVAHIRDARLDHGGKADAVMAALGPRRIAARQQFAQIAVAYGRFERRGKVPGIEERASRRPIRHCAWRDEIATNDIEGIELKFHRDLLHQPFKRIIGLRAAEAAVEPGRRFVGQDNAVTNFDVADVVGAGQIAMHAVERGRLRRAQMRPAILELIEGERGDAAVGINGGLERRHAIGGRHRGAQMLQAILDPFHRPVGDTRGDRDQDDVRKDRLLDAKAAARIRRRPQPQPVARDLERPRHDRMQAERPLEIGEHVIGALARVVFGNDAVGLDRGRNSADSARRCECGARLSQTLVPARRSKTSARR